MMSKMSKDFTIINIFMQSLETAAIFKVLVITVANWQREKEISHLTRKKRQEHKSRNFLRKLEEVTARSLLIN